MTQFIYSTIQIDGKQVGVRRAAPSKSPATPAASEPEVDYSGLSKTALMALANDRSIEVTGRMTKAKIIAALEGAD